MANEIKYQINGQLADNTVTVDNKEDMILVPVSIGSADENRIIAELKAEDSGLREETIRHVFDLQKRVIKRMLMTGMSVNTGLYYASVAFRGVIENSTWNPAKNSIVVNFNVGADLRKPSRQPQWASSARKAVPCTSAAYRMPPPVHRMLRPRQDAPSPSQAAS